MKIGYLFILLYLLMVLSGIALSYAVRPGKAFPDLEVVKAKDGYNIFMFGLKERRQ